MEAKINDPYFDGILHEFSNGEKLLTRQKIQYKSSPEDKKHIIIGGDTLSKIAKKYYTGKVKNPELYYYIIADVNDIINPQSFDDLQDLIGFEILIPDILTAKLIT